MLLQSKPLLEGFMVLQANALLPDSAFKTQLQLTAVVHASNPVDLGG